jgi:precorrin-2 dehydrogenase/sirohydrochlorin ferrochelatase
MAGYPVVLRLHGRLCLVVGAGTIARRKIQKLLAAGAEVRVVAPEIPPELRGDPRINTICRLFMPEDLDGVFLVFAATNDRGVNARVAACAQRQGKLINVADHPEESDFHLPALLQRGELTVTVSSAGASPALAVQLRDHLAAGLGPEWQIFCTLAAALRQKRLTEGDSSAYNRAVISALLAADLPRLLASQDEEAVNKLLTKVTGVAMTLADLGIQFGKGTT